MALLDASEDLAAEFAVRQWAEDLLCGFFVNAGASDLFGEFVVKQWQEDLLGEFVVRRSVPSALVLGPQRAATATYWCLAWPFQRKVWYRAGRHWVFYVHDYQFRYVSSIDGVVWDGPTDIRYAPLGYTCATWVDDNGYLHYVYCLYGNGRTLKYRRGFLESDGTITWSAVEQDAAASYATEQFRPSICVDDAGYPWITYTRENLSGYYEAQVVTKSSTNDGTWTTAPNYPVEIRPPRSRKVTANITPIVDGKAFVSNIEGNTTTVRGWLCDDGGPGALQSIVSPSEATSEHGITTIVSLGDTAWISIDTDDGIHVAKYQDGNWVGVVQADAAGTWPSSTFMVGRYIYAAWQSGNTWMRRISMDGGTTWGASGVLLHTPGIDDARYSSFASYLENPLGFAWLHPHPGLAIYYGWIDVVSAPELRCIFNVGQDAEDLKATFEAQASVDLLGIFNVQQEAMKDLFGEFDVGQDAVDLHGQLIIRRADTLDLAGEFIVKQWQLDLPARFRVMKVYDLRGTAGIAFYWQGADNPPESIVDFIVESATGFWVAEFYDGPANLRYIFIPWTQFRETGIDGTRPDLAQVDGFICIVHTSGLRRIDYIHAPFFGNLYAVFTTRHAAAVDLAAGFTSQAVRDLPAKFSGQTNVNLPAAFEIRQGFNDLAAEFYVMVDRITLIDEQILLAQAGEVNFTGLDLNTHKTYILTVQSKNIAGAVSYLRWGANDNFTSASYQYRYVRNGSPYSGSDNRISYFNNNLRWWMEIRFFLTPDGRITYLGQEAHGAITVLDVLSGSLEVDSANLTKLTLRTETSVGGAQTGFETGSIFRLYGYVS